jgi:hypothetical protein
MQSLELNVALCCFVVQAALAGTSTSSFAVGIRLAASCTWEWSKACMHVLSQVKSSQHALNMFTEGKAGASEGATKVGTWRHGCGGGCEHNRR